MFARPPTTQTLRNAELELKKLTNKLKHFKDERSHAERSVSNLLEKHPWIREDKQFFGRRETDYDFEARDPSEAQRRLKTLKEEQAALSKKVCSIGCVLNKRLDTKVKIS